jgi:tRNA(Arg) A34 adenosine deaminase TadA
MRGGNIIAAARNAMRTSNDPTAHAEMMALRRAGEALGTSRLDECDLWVTLEPCAMCAGAIALARIRRLYFAAPDPRAEPCFTGPRLFSQPDLPSRAGVYPASAKARRRQCCAGSSASGGLASTLIRVPVKDVVFVEATGRPSASSAGRYLNRSSMISQVALSSLKWPLDFVTEQFATYPSA